MARKDRVEPVSWDIAEPEPVFCPLCERVIPMIRKTIITSFPRARAESKLFVCTASATTRYMRSFRMPSSPRSSRQ